MHREAGRIILAVELYILVLALLLSGAVWFLFRFLPFLGTVKYFAAITVLVIIIFGAAVFAPLFGKSVNHSIKDGVLNVQYGVFFKYSVNVDFNRVVYITKIKGPFERMCGVTVLVFYFSGGRVFLPAGDSEKAERYIKKWKQRIL